MAPTSLRAQIVRNGKHTDARAVVLSLKDGGWGDLEKSGRNKLRMGKVKRAFLRGKCGAVSELEWGSATALADLPQDRVLVLSAGEDYSGVIAPAPTQDDGTPAPPPCCINILCKQSHLDAEAASQLEAVCRRLHGVRHGIGLPDLHPGRGFPVGAAIASAGRIHPPLVGNDIGCGMLLLRTHIPRAKAEKDSKKDRWAELLRNSDMDEAMDSATAMELLGRLDPALLEGQHAAYAQRFCGSFGTVGGGNHFAELQVIDKLCCDNAELDPDMAFLMVHSGSRGMGSEVLSTHLESGGGGGGSGLPDEGDEAAAYLSRHDYAVSWAGANRRAIASRFLHTIGEEAGGTAELADMCHNFVERQRFGGEDLWLHRKGAAPATKGWVVIPGSRGARSYLVEPTEAAADGGQGEGCGFSLAHGAGREMDRASAVSCNKGESPADLQTTSLGSRVVCNDVNLLFEEAPSAYKQIESVIEDLSSAGLVRVLAILRPVVTFKTAVRKGFERKKK